MEALRCERQAIDEYHQKQSQVCHVYLRLCHGFICARRTAEDGPFGRAPEENGLEHIGLCALFDAFRNNERLRFWFDRNFRKC